MTSFKSHELELVKSLIDSKAVDFGAIGTAFAKHGASATLTMDGEDFFCGTMRRFIRLFRIAEQPASLEQLRELQQIGSQIKG